MASPASPISAIPRPRRMSMSPSARPLRRCSAPSSSACRKRPSFWRALFTPAGADPGTPPGQAFAQKQPFGSRRGALRRRVELAGDVAALLGQAAEAIGVAADFIDMEVALVMQRSQQLAHAFEHGREIGRLFVLGVGALADVDVEPEACEIL